MHVFRCVRLAVVLFGGALLLGAVSPAAAQSPGAPDTMEADWMLAGCYKLEFECLSGQFIGSKCFLSAKICP